MLSETFAFGFPPRSYALAAYRALLDDEAPGAHWMIAGLGVDIHPLTPEAIGGGRHVRVGLEDIPFGTSTTNRALVQAAVRLIGRNGGEPATAAAMRQVLRSLNRGTSLGRRSSIGRLVIRSGYTTSTSLASVAADSSSPSLRSLRLRSRCHARPTNADAR